MALVKEEETSSFVSVVFLNMSLRVRLLGVFGRENFILIRDIDRAASDRVE
jgi:hypothetical protein